MSRRTQRRWAAGAGALGWTRCAHAGPLQRPVMRPRFRRSRPL